MTETLPLFRASGGRTASDRPGRRSTGRAPQQVYVLYTDVEETLCAVRVADQLASAIGGGVTVIHFRMFGFAEPLDHPAGPSPVEAAAFTAGLAAEDCDARVRVCLCRDARQAIRSVIDRHSLVVIGGRRRWWPTPSSRWRRTLEEEGYAVVFVPTSPGTAPADRARFKEPSSHDEGETPWLTCSTSRSESPDSSRSGPS
jgi:hypothetical protein